MSTWRFALWMAALFSIVETGAFCRGSDEPRLRVGTFEVDATPPLGTPISYSPAQEVLDPLSCRGIVLLSDQLPIVLCAIDWVSLDNGAHDAFRLGLAEAAGTSPDRVAVHVLHQHDAPHYDFEAELIQAAFGAGFPQDFCHDTIRRAGEAVRAAIAGAQPVTHVGTGIGRISEVASNRRILGPDGKVIYSRWSSGNEDKVRAAPEGLIDPDLRLVSLWNNEQPLVVLTYYATHPQSYYTHGKLSSDFVGMARDRRQRETGVFHVHFDGAGGNITAGKYNDGSPATRPLLAQRLAQGAKTAWETQTKLPVSAEQLAWQVVPCVLPICPEFNEQQLLERLRKTQKWEDACDLAWLHRCRNGHAINIACLSLGRTRMLHMPGELFIEYQLAAQALRPDLFVCMAAYGDCGPGYLGTREAYPQGGYETRVTSSKVAPETEDVLTQGLRKLLGAEDRTDIFPSLWTLKSPRLEPASP